MHDPTRRRTAFACLLFLALAPSGAAAEASPEAPTAESIEACVRANLPSRSSVQDVVLRVKDPTGATTESHIKIYWQQDEDRLSKVMLRFDEPPDMRGSALLLLEQPGRNDMFMYLPELKRVRRVTGPALSGGMFGTDFTYSQFERLQGVARDLVVERLEDETLGGEPLHVLAHTPADDPEFEYVKSYVEPERCLPMRTEFFEPGRHLRKVLTVDPARIERIDGHWIPRRLVMEDVVHGSSTEFLVEDIEVEADIHRRIFTERHLTSGR